VRILVESGVRIAWAGAVALSRSRVRETDLNRWSDRLGEQIERGDRPQRSRNIDGEFVVAATEVLDEGEPGHDHGCGAVSPQPTHRS